MLGTDQFGTPINDSDEIVSGQIQKQTEPSMVKALPFKNKSITKVGKEK